MSTIPTIYEFIDELDLLDAEYPRLSEHIAKRAIQFTKLHVEQALKVASEKASLHVSTNDWQQKFVDKDSILNSYPLENIK